MRHLHRAVTASRRKRRRVEVAIATAVAAVGVSGLVFLTTADDDRPTSAAPTAVATTDSPTATQASPSVPSPVEGSAPAPPQTVAGLIADLTARPDAAGPAGPLLRDGLQGLVSGDEGVRQRSAVQVLSIVISGEALDPRYATATRLALFRTMTGLASAPSAPAGPPSCLEIRQGMPPPVVQGYARQIVDQLPAWQADGFPADETARLQELVTPVAAGQATLDLRPCPGQ
ncbi:hypothetical protein [Blastococcus mobilis]|uniref:hypothetical protein n=1 Tax=Blastococcus mobilis TaxID=1938746 RepID=UPI0020CF15F9|nr:hypothetical protein [Blastococcus mobilis]